MGDSVSHLAGDRIYKAGNSRCQRDCFQRCNSLMYFMYCIPLRAVMRDCLSIACHDYYY